MTMTSNVSYGIAILVCVCARPGQVRLVVSYVRAKRRRAMPFPTVTIKVMIDRTARGRVTRLAWAAVLGAAAFLAIDTVAAIARIGLAGARPPLPPLQTALRIAVVVGAFGLLAVVRGGLERITLLVGAAAAGSSALYGFGLRSPALSSFRLLSHLAVYVLAMAVALGRIGRRT
jgi:hypothetical protein